MSDNSTQTISPRSPETLSQDRRLMTEELTHSISGFGAQSCRGVGLDVKRACAVRPDESSVLAESIALIFSGQSHGLRQRAGRSSGGPSAQRVGVHRFSVLRQSSQYMGSGSVVQGNLGGSSKHSSSSGAAR